MFLAIWYLLDLFVRFIVNQIESKRIWNIKASYKCLCIFLIFLTSQIKRQRSYYCYIGMLNTNPCFLFSKKRWFLKTARTFSILSSTLLHLQKYYINQNKNYIFIIRKDWSFCDQNLKLVAILLKKVNIFVFIFCNFNFSFFPKYSPMQYSTRLWLSKGTKFIRFFYIFKKL